MRVGATPSGGPPILDVLVCLVGVGPMTYAPRGSQ